MLPNIIEPYDQVRGTDSGHFKADIKEIKADIKEIKNDFVEMKVEHTRAYKELYGNGTPGIKQKVNKNCEYIQTQKGGFSAVKFIIGLSGINGLILIGVAIKLFT